MSKTYNITGKRFLRLYTAKARTASYAAVADAYTIANSLCDVEWTDVSSGPACFPFHAGKEASDIANVNNREMFDAAMFCAEHDAENGMHRAYAQAACYRFSIPAGITLQSLTAVISCDPYTPDGARVAIYTSDEPTPPMRCTICRTGSEDGGEPSTVVDDSDGDGINDTWTTTGRYADHVAPRRTVTDSSGNATWFVGSGNVVFNPTGGVTLSKYLFVFVLLENYNTSRSGYLEGSSYVQPKVSVTLSQAIPAWDAEIDSGKTAIDASAPVGGSDYPICRGGILPSIDPMVCAASYPADRFTEAPMTDTCVPEPDVVRQYTPSSENHFIIEGSPSFDITSNTPWDLFTTFGDSLTGRSVPTGAKPITGGSQLIYSIGKAVSFHYHLYAYPMFNCFVRYHPMDTTPYTQVACVIDQHTSMSDYWPADYSVPKPVAESDRRDEIITSNGRMLTVVPEDDNYGIERDPVTLYSPFSRITHKGMVSIGANISSVSCLLNPSDLASGHEFAPGVRFLVASYAPSSDGKQISDFFEFIEDPEVFGLTAIKGTSAYTMLSEGTATSVFVGDSFGIDDDPITGVPNLSSIVSELSGVTVGEAAMIKDVSEMADSEFGHGQTLGGAPSRYDGLKPYVHTDPFVYGDTTYTSGYGGEQQMVYEFAFGTDQYNPGPSLSLVPGISSAYSSWVKPLSQDSVTSVTYPVFVTDGVHTHLLALMRLVTRTCPDVVAYPTSADVNRFAPSLSTMTLTQWSYGSDGYMLFNVKPCFLSEFTGTFVQFWAPDDSFKTYDFGPCSGVRHSRLRVPKAIGSWVEFDSSTGKATLSSAKGSVVSLFSYDNDEESGTCSFTYGGTTLTGNGRIFGVYVPPVKFSPYAYVYGSFTSFGNVPVHSIFRVRFVSGVPVVDGLKIDTSFFPLARASNESSDSDTDPIEFTLHPPKACATDSTFGEDDVILTSTDTFTIPGAGDVQMCKISSIGSSSYVISAPSPQLASIDPTTAKGVLVADENAGIIAFSRSPGVGTVYEVKVYPEDSELFASNGDRTIGLRNCMARFYEGNVSLSPTVSKRSVGPVFLIGKAKKLVKVWASTELGQQIVGRAADVWRIIFSSSCIPFSVPDGTKCDKMTVDWSSVRMSEDPEPEGDIESSVSSSGDTLGPVAVVSRYSKCSRGTKFNIWLNRTSRVGSVPDDVASDHAFYDGTKTVIGDWELVATVDPYAESRSVDVDVGRMDGKCGTVALSAWYPFEGIDSKTDLSSMLGAGEAADYSTSHSVPQAGYGWVPDIIFHR